MNLVVPVLLGAGVVLSGLASAIDRIARLTAMPSMERGLARQLSTCNRRPAASWRGARRPFRPR